MTRVEENIRKKRLRREWEEKKRKEQKERELWTAKVDPRTYKRICALVKSIFGIRFYQVKIGEMFFLNNQKWSKCGRNCALLLREKRVVEISPRDICVLG